MGEIIRSDVLQLQWLVHNEPKVSAVPCDVFGHVLITTRSTAVERGALGIGVYCRWQLSFLRLLAFSFQLKKSTAVMLFVANWDLVRPFDVFCLITATASKSSVGLIRA